MKLFDLSDAPAFNSEKFVAENYAVGTNSNVRIIRLSSGQALPTHTHGESDLMLLIVEGNGVLTTDEGDIAFLTGSLAQFSGTETLNVRNDEAAGLTLFAFLAPIFP